MRFPFERILAVFFLIVIAGVVILGVVNYNANRSYSESTEWVEHTYEVIEESTLVLSALQDMGIRGYVTTGDTAFLESYYAASKVLMPRLDSLDMLTLDNPAEQDRIRTLRRLSHIRLDLCTKYIALANGNKMDAENLAVFTRESKINMNSIRAVTSEIRSAEEMLLKNRKIANEQSRHSFNLSVALIFSEIVMLLIGTLAAVLLYLFHRTKYEKNILQLNASMEGNIIQLNNANKELESFSYSVSHDLRAPLRIIDGFAKILAEEYKTMLDDEGKRFIEAIRTNAQHMGQLIDDLLNFSRIGRQELAIQDVVMKDIISKVVDLFGIHHKTLGAEIQVGNILNAKCDEHLIRQVWVNLLSNALKYSRNEEHPQIRIDSEQTASEIIYSISDNGVGFDMEFSDKLFGVFQRLHKVSDYEGTGVGLALVNRIVTRHKGRVWASSAPNEGAIFYFSLPIIK